VRVVQLGHGLIPGDAVSDHTLEFDRRLRAWGFGTSIFAATVSPEFRAVAQTDDRFEPAAVGGDDLLIYHYSIYDPNYRQFIAARCRKMLVYHNITPSRFFQDWDRSLAAQCEAGLRVLAEMHDCDLAVGVSEYNRRELVQRGFPSERTGVLPIFLSQDAFEQVPTDQRLREQLDATGDVNWLFVGRIVPNKAIEDLLRLFWLYHRDINPLSHLYLVGSRYVASYAAFLDGMVREGGLEDSVTFTGLISRSHLKTYYQAADLYLHASHHEGFCVPLLESMYFGVPILARKAAAVPETLGSAGVLFTRLGYREVAEMAHLLLTDQALRQQVIARQRERLLDFHPSRVEEELRRSLVSLGLLPE
jgi:L-malate glycosyltransferase